MNKLFLICILIVSAAICAAAQNKPFSSIDNFLAKNGGDFNNREEIVKLFNEERVALGTDVEKHYWISSFLDWKEYLQGNQPLPELSFKIKKRGVKLIGDAQDEVK